MKQTFFDFRVFGCCQTYLQMQVRHKSRDPVLNNSAVFNYLF